MRHLAWLLCCGLLWAASVRACPDLQNFYPDDNTNWFVLERELARLLPQCLDNPEYFALYGAAQLNSGQVAAAAESLERALLMQPDYGAAQIDYAEALFLQGQIFSAMDMNRLLLARNDLPADLSDMLEQRQQDWRAMTRQTNFQVDSLLGYDSNLNRGPSTNQITVTLSGEPIELELSPDVLPIAGAYANLRVAASHSRLQPGASHNWMSEFTGRVSEDNASDLVQFNGRYAYARERRSHAWQSGGAVSHLQLGGRALLSAAEANAFYQQASDRACGPYYGIAAQYQYYHERSSHLDAVETRSTGGLACDRIVNNAALTAELSQISSFAVYSDRPGGNRHGWQARLTWQHELPLGSVTAQVSHSRLIDRKGYSELLDDGARRDLSRDLVLLQYRYPLVHDWLPGAILMVNAFHQRQHSNLALFDSRDSAVEAGLRFNF
jgi:tetratricopeptide (TPR) repeat protein